NSSSLVKKQLLNLKYSWSLFVLYIYGYCLYLRNAVRLYS
ncbi:ABC1 family protein, partial [Danaus plexippus plexippus]